MSQGHRKGKSMTLKDKDNIHQDTGKPNQRFFRIRIMQDNDNAIEEKVKVREIQDKNEGR